MARSGNGLRIPFDLWGQRGWPAQEVAGESHYTKEIRALFGDQYNPAGSELTLAVQLVPEPHNQYDRNAVAIQCGGATVGYLPREDAAQYSGVLSTLVAEGWVPQVAARVWGADRVDYDYDRRGNQIERSVFVGSVRLDLAEPHLLVPANPPPSEDCAMLPAGNAVQVTGEEDHMEVLSPLLCPAGQCWIHVTLHEVLEQLARSNRTVVEVRVDGAAAGRLTPKMSAGLLPAIRHLAGRGVQTGARAILKGNRVKADVTLYVARANELSQEWLDHPPTTAVQPRTLITNPVGGSGGPAVRPEMMEPAGEAVPSAGYGATGSAQWRFNPPPGWPPPPEDWFPSPGWRPDPAWPPAPSEWQFWVPR